MTYAIITFLLLIIAGMLVGFVRMTRHYRRNIDKVRFVFDAMDNVDFSFNFPTDIQNKNDELLNKSLNRIKQILKNARDESIEREKYYEKIINSVDTGILIVNHRGNVLQHNKAALRLLGINVLTHIDRVKDKLECGNLSKRETPAVLKGHQVSIIALNDINNELSNQEVDSWIKLIRVLTHEIMNTITPITSLSETLLHNAKGEQRDGLEVINKTGRELISFVENYRRFTHVPKPQPTLFYLRPFLQRMISLTDRAVELSVEPADMMLYADESLISHVVTNVLKNAVQATTPAQNISIKAFTDDRDTIIIDITNNGELIPDDVAQHIFVPFFSTKAEGSGIGLSLSRQIMRLSNGSITLIQDPKHDLVTFRLTFL